jgi:hypothetical protein
MSITFEKIYRKSKSIFMSTANKGATLQTITNIFIYDLIVYGLLSLKTAKMILVSFLATAPIATL